MSDTARIDTNLAKMQAQGASKAEMQQYFDLEKGRMGQVAQPQAQQQTQPKSSSRLDGELLTVDEVLKNNLGMEPGIERPAIVPLRRNDKGELEFIVPEIANVPLRFVTSFGVGAKGGEVDPADIVQGAFTVAGPGLATSSTKRAATTATRAAAGMLDDVADDGGRAASKVIPRASLEDFQASNISPTAPAVSGSNTVATMAEAGRNVPIVGAPQARAQTRALSQVAAAQDDIAGAIGRSSGDDQAFGEALEQSITRFARQRVDDVSPEAAIQQPARMSSFSTKQGALYRRLENRIGDAEVDLAPARRAIEAAVKPSQNEQVSAVLGVPELRKYFIEGPVTWAEARNLRTTLRTDLKKAADAAGRSIDDRVIDDVYNAFTQSLMNTAQRAGGVALANQMRRADQFTAAGMNRINKALAKFMGTSKKDVTAGEVANKIRSLALEQGNRASVRQLSQLRQSLRDDEWADVSATFFQRLGKPRGGGVNAETSIDSFVTDWRNLSEGAKKELFASGPAQSQKQRIESFVKAVNALKEAGAVRNVSETGSKAIAGGALFGAGMETVTTGIPITTIIVGTSVRGLNEVLMSPAATTWLTRAFRIAKAGARGVRGSQERWVNHLSRANAIAQQEPAFAGVLRALSPAQEEQTEASTAVQ